MRKCPHRLRGTPRYWGYTRRPVGAGRQGSDTRACSGISPCLIVIRRLHNRGTASYLTQGRKFFTHKGTEVFYPQGTASCSYYVRGNPRGGYTLGPKTITHVISFYGKVPRWSGGTPEGVTPSDRLGPADRGVTLEHAMVYHPA